MPSAGIAGVYALHAQERSTRVQHAQRVQRVQERWCRSRRYKSVRNVGSVRNALRSYSRVGHQGKSEERLCRHRGAAGPRTARESCPRRRSSPSGDTRRNRHIEPNGSQPSTGNAPSATLRVRIVHHARTATRTVANAQPAHTVAKSKSQSPSTSQSGMGNHFGLSSTSGRRPWHQSQCPCDGSHARGGCRCRQTTTPAAKAARPATTIQSAARVMRRPRRGLGYKDRCGRAFASTAAAGKRPCRSWMHLSVGRHDNRVRGLRAAQADDDDATLWHEDCLAGGQ